MYKIILTFRVWCLLGLLVIIVTGCGKSSDDGPDLKDIPHYPNASKSESIQQSAMGGMVSGSLEQYTTTDSFQEVVDFYNNALKQYQTESMSHTSELGQQTVFSITRSNGITSVAIQEFSEEDRVNITFMSVSQ